jgi:signal transduction histidine kinase
VPASNHHDSQQIIARVFLNSVTLAVPAAALVYGLFGAWDRALRTFYLLLILTPLLVFFYRQLRRGKAQQVLIGLSLTMWLGLSVQLVSAGTLINPITPVLICLAVIGNFARHRLLIWLNPCLCLVTVLGVGMAEKYGLLPVRIPPGSLAIGLGVAVAITYMSLLSYVSAGQLAQLNAQLFLAMDAGKIHCFNLNPQRQTVLADEETGHLLGCSPGEQPVHQLQAFSTADRQKMLQSCRLLAAGQEVAPLDCRLESGPFEGRWFRLFTTTAHNQPDSRICAMQDIHEQKEADLAKENFTAMVSHELRTPLTSLLGALSLLRGLHGKEMPAAAQELLEMANRGGERLAKLVNEILDFFKLQAGRMPINARLSPLNPDIESALDSVSALLQEKQLDIQREGFDKGLPVYHDSSRTQQVIINLLSNAIKFSPPGSTLLLSLATTQEHLRLSVRDQGPGIPEDFQPQLFKPFSQANMGNTRDDNSTGLGLAFSRQLMQLMGGELSFSSPPGQGATFHLDFLPEAPTP